MSFYKSSYAICKSLYTKLLKNSTPAALGPPPSLNHMNQFIITNTENHNVLLHCFNSPRSTSVCTFSYLHSLLLLVDQRPANTLEKQCIIY